MALRELQQALAASLSGRGAVPAGCDPPQVARVRDALEAKRRRAAGHLLPGVRSALGPSWRGRFRDHARTYVPLGMLYHVDDAWAFADTLARAGDAEIRRAAHDDLLALRVRYVRARGAGPDRIRERRTPFLAVTRGAPKTLVIRLPGGAGSIWRFQISP